MPPRGSDEPPYPAWILAEVGLRGTRRDMGLMAVPEGAAGLVVVLLLAAAAAGQDWMPSLPLPLLVALFLPGLVAVWVEAL